MRDIQAIEREQACLLERPRSAPSLHALHRLALDAGDRDAAWRSASALVFLGEADRDERHRFERDRPRGPIRARLGLDDRHWLGHLRHPDQDLLVSKLLEQLWPACLSLRGRSDRDAGLSARYRVDPARSTVTLARTFGWVAQVLGICAPRLYLRQDVQGGLAVLPTWPTASLSGATLLEGFAPDALTFVVARHLADYRSEHYVRTLMPSVLELEVLARAALSIGLGACAPDPRVDAVAAELVRKLVPAQLGALATLSQRIVRTTDTIDVARWARGVELTACRAGLLACNDLAVAAQMVGALGRAGPNDVPIHEKVDDLIRFSVSDDYAALRRALGITMRHG